MPKRQGGRSGVASLDHEGSRPRQHCRIDFAPEFESSAAKLAKLGPSAIIRTARAAAAARSFFELWQTKTAVTDHELRGTKWQFKPLQGTPAKGAKLRQIYLDGRRGILRVALVIDEGDDWCAMTFLLAYHKRDQEVTAIDRAVAIAQERQRGRS